MKPRVSVVVTAKDEDDAIMGALARIAEAVEIPCEILVVCDSLDDTTVPWVKKYAEEDDRVHLVINGYGPGPARAIRSGFDAAVADGGHHFQIDAQQIVAAHAGLARHTGGDDADIGPGDVLVVLRAFQAHVATDHRGRLGDVERLALGQAFDDVEQDDVAQLLPGADVGQRAPDHARSDEGDLRARHSSNSSRKPGGEKAARGLDRRRRPCKARPCSASIRHSWRPRKP